MKLRQSYIGFLFCLSIFVAGLAPIVGYAQAVSFARGQVLNHMLSVCLDKKDALAILDADEKDGFAAASVIWDAAPRCSTLPVTGGPKVGRVVKSAQVKRGDRSITAKVVEIVHGGEVIGYFFTTATVDERNS